MNDSQTSIKMAPKKSIKPVGRAITYPQVLRVLQRDEMRSMALKHFKIHGGNADSFKTKRNQQLMADALTALEDWMEIKHERWHDERSSVKNVRRLIEDYLDT